MALSELTADQTSYMTEILDRGLDSLDFDDNPDDVQAERLGNSTAAFEEM
jgi:hypothetical protein